VVPGETLPKIAAQHKVSAQAILAVNPGVDFSLIIAGQIVHVPSRCLALQFAEMVSALLVPQAQAGQMQALQTQPLQELEELANDLADIVSEHLKAENAKFVSSFARSGSSRCCYSRHLRSCVSWQ